MIAKIDNRALEGGWRSLCANVMLQAVQRLSGTKLCGTNSHYHLAGGGVSKEVLYQKMCARDWIAGGTGLITWEDCCDSLGVDPSLARAIIMERLPEEFSKGNSESRREQ